MSASAHRLDGSVVWPPPPIHAPKCSEAPDGRYYGDFLAPIDLMLIPPELSRMVDPVYEVPLLI